MIDLPVVARVRTGVGIVVHSPECHGQSSFCTCNEHGWRPRLLPIDSIVVVFEILSANRGSARSALVLHDGIVCSVYILRDEVHCVRPL